MCVQRLRCLVYVFFSFHSSYIASFGFFIFKSYVMYIWCVVAKIYIEREREKKERGFVERFCFLSFSSFSHHISLGLAHSFKRAMM